MTPAGHCTVRSRRWGCVAAALVLAGCASSDPSGVDSPPSTAGAPTTTGSAVEIDTGVDTSQPAASSAPPTDSTSSTLLVPSESADLPTRPPGATTPPTTVSGPLSDPAVQLVDIGTFDTPTEVTNRPLDDRTFVVEQGGRVFAVGELSDDVVLDITDLTEARGERGLLGVAFHPEQDLAYVHYSDVDGNTAVDEYAIDPVTAVFDPQSRRAVLTVEQPFSNHNGGELTFGPDGYLYLGLGDGGSADDPQRTALDLSSRLGKILRIDPIASGSDSFTIPADNPFVDVAAADPAIWSYGLRNPWKFSFDAATGDLWIGDVGQGDVEEIDLARAVEGRNAGKGLNFGWSAFEGLDRFNEDQNADGSIEPVVTYSHDDGDCSVSAGAVYRGEQVPDLVGWFVYGDYCSGRIWGFDPSSSADNPRIVELAELGTLAAIAVGGDGELFAVSNSGTVARFAPA